MSLGIILWAMLEKGGSGCREQANAQHSGSSGKFRLTKRTQGWALESHFQDGLPTCQPPECTGRPQHNQQPSTTCFC
jgi:hypothetical protein